MVRPLSLVILSGEHPTLPLAELKAVLEAHKINFRINKLEYKLVELDVEKDALNSIVGRGAFVDETAVEILQSRPTFEDIDRALHSASLHNSLGPKDTLSVRVARFGGVSKQLKRAEVEQYIGGQLAKLTGARVNLVRPSKLFRGFLTGDTFPLGLSCYQRPAGSIAARRPRKRAVFHPSTMMPKLARCLVNLSRVVDDTVFLDPFCGVGGLLVEASMLGCSVIGIDALKRMLRGSRKNMSHFNLKTLGFLRADARKLPLKNVGAIATDPPYGTGASTLKSTTRKIMIDFLPEARGILGTGGRTVIASPKGTGGEDIAKDSGFSISENHEIYVHRRLTREILVLEAK